MQSFGLVWCDVSACCVQLRYICDVIVAVRCKRVLVVAFAFAFALAFAFAFRVCV